ncbi:hypothetical protein [Terrihabitans sp. B22-R8]|uniref:hypothetical protein n=1 Tax=Terrihabitans sp. B22-R8 TaxID=3425128 RepID=UPI00403C16F1
MSTRFILRDTPAPGDVNVRIHQDADVVLGEVIAPDVAGSHTAADADQDGALGVHQALASAIEIAGHHGNVVRIIDPEGLWREEWGVLDAD